jgi:alpha-L-fucosidase
MDRPEGRGYGPLDFLAPQTNGDTIDQSGLYQVRRSNYASFPQTGNTLSMHIDFWPGEAAASALNPRVKSVHLLKTRTDMKSPQNEFKARFFGLPKKAPDFPVTTIVIECDSEPMQDMDFVRIHQPRDGV